MPFLSRTALLILLALPLTFGADFTVQGAQLRDPSGAPFVVRGVNVQGMKYGWPGDVATEVGLIVDTWGFNAVRVNCFIDTAYWNGEDVSKYSHYQDIPSMDALVQAFTSRGVVVIFEWHDRTGGYFEGADLEKLKTAMRELCARHGSNPYVWYNVMNEPGNWAYDATRWLAVHRAVMAVIRDEMGVNAPIVIDGASWGQDIHEDNVLPTSTSMILDHAKDLKAFNGKTYENLIFSFHTYGRWDIGTLEQATAKMRNYVQRATDAGICLMVGEWGVGDNNFAFNRAMHATAQVCQSLGIGRMAWAWAGTDDFDLTKGGNGGGQHVEVRNGAAVNLTPFGRLVWDDLRYATGNPTPPALLLPEVHTATFPNQPLLTCQAVAGAQPLGPSATVQWELLTAPAGATVSFANPTALSSTIQVDRPGEYLVQIRVTTPSGVGTARTAVVVNDPAEREMVVNGGFELETAAWETLTGYPTITTENPAADSKSLAMTGSWNWIQQGVTILEPGQTYVLKASGKMASGELMVGVKSDHFDQKLRFTTSGGANWQVQQLTFEVPGPRGTWCVVYIGLSGTGDGRVDGVSLAPVSRPGDVNGDDVVNASDLSAVRGQFGRTGTSIRPTGADLDGNGQVDATDLGRVLSYQSP